MKPPWDGVGWNPGGAGRPRGTPGTEDCGMPGCIMPLGPGCPGAPAAAPAGTAFFLPRLNMIRRTNRAISA
eukprot:CAMPEP_0202902530 /NCGR_PEP_ID=MMETSP1392-20130828/16909_1 /ASSEMBLY_ACC=CAM_ASM_000868 /TAXON_ID=225041 /ORGANISM="Chlamydomonas chlamydogama, Strain SAG 11-48b" /LENGTH=70 /DNA_ID=CAMNT_0049589309 /DNA_START=909 /DNA_END=1121 /DNA_ORIENTATION=+